MFLRYKSMDHPIKISVVFSIFNESESLQLLFPEIKKLVSTGNHIYELLFVDDGSSDDSVGVIRDFRQSFIHPRCKTVIIRLSRNFGHEAAMIAGIDNSSGDAVICMDADLQHPLTFIPEMIAKFENGYQVVNMIRRKNKGVSGWNEFLSHLFYKFFNSISINKLHEYASDFFLISQKIAGILKQDFRERNRFLRGFIQIIGFNKTTIEFDAPHRLAGRTKYSFSRLMTLTGNAITSFSKSPLFLGVWFGFLFAAVSVVLGIYTLWIYFFGTLPPSGYTTIVLFLSIGFSILFFLIGIIGIYIGYLFDEQKERPIYLVAETDGLENTVLHK
jgi:polyisoprenyl-phosphate glycosyltransferase